MPVTQRLVTCLLALMAGCSLHSLDYLDAGSQRGATASSGAGNGLGPSGGLGGSSDVSTTAGDAPGGSANGGAGSTDPVGPLTDAGAAGSEANSALCADLQQNGEETDLDCGGRSCGPCGDGKTCAKGTDCQSAVCTNVVCQAPSCTDLALNGTETDLNCGGGCPACAQGKHCAVDGDCSTGNCMAGICEPEACADGVLSEGCLLIDNTPYSLSPAKAPNNCLDNELDSLANGNALRIHPCRSELRQTFWAVQQAGGYFAFRNALSGKCLQVRGASTTGGATIEQSTCSSAPEQLWKPSLVDTTLISLTSRVSGLSLNVAGDNANIDGQPIVQGHLGNVTDTLWRVTRRSTASYVTFSPEMQPASHIQHSAELVTLGADDQASAQWIVVPGLSDPSLVSFQSRNDPGRYLHHAVLRLWSDINDGTEAFKHDATFRFVQPLVGVDRLDKTIELSDLPGLYWRSDVTRGVVFALFADNPDYKFSATWRLSGR